MTQASRVLLFTILFLPSLLQPHIALGQVAGTSPSSASPVKVSPDAASTLVIQKSALKYPSAARDAGIEGTIVLGVVVSETGVVKEVKIISGDLALAQPAADSVKQWKYKPYTQNDMPVEMEGKGSAF